MFQKSGEQFSRIQMGSQREKEIKAQIKNLNKLETDIGYDFNRRRRMIKNSGTNDYTMKRAIVYRENYINEMKKYENFENYDKLKNKLETIKNPLSFYDYVSKNEYTGDLTWESDNYYSQLEFNKFLQDLGIEIDDLNNEEAGVQEINEILNKTQEISKEQNN